MVLSFLFFPICRLHKPNFNCHSNVSGITVKGHFKSIRNILPIYSFRAVHNITWFSVSAITWTCAWDCAIQNESDYGCSEWLYWSENKEENRDYNLQHLILLISSTHCWEEGKCVYIINFINNYPVCNNTGALLTLGMNNYCPSAHCYLHILFACQKPNSKNHPSRPPPALPSIVQVTAKVTFFFFFYL